METKDNTCASLFGFTKFIYNKDINIEERLNINSIYEWVKEIFINVRYDHSNLLLDLHNTDHVMDKNYIYSHTMRTTIITIIIGKYLKIPTHKLIEMGAAALLHDIGMLSIPQELYLSSRPLTRSEKKIINMHTVYGYKLLDSYGFSKPIKLAVLEHHEREDGTGYPLKLKKEKISLYGKIIGLACSYEAISADRIYKESVDLHAGIIEILKNKGKFYDVAIQALVNSLSIYPIGMYVLLSDDTKGMVVDANSYDPRYPIVQLLDEKTFDGKNIVRHTFSDGLHIVRPLKNEEV